MRTLSTLVVGALGLGACEHGYDLDVTVVVAAPLTATASSDHPLVIETARSRAVICAPVTAPLTLHVRESGFGYGPKGTYGASLATLDARGACRRSPTFVTRNPRPDEVVGPELAASESAIVTVKDGWTSTVKRVEIRLE